jgi:hypothetical protein
MHEQADGGDAAHWRYKAASDWSGGGALRRSISGFSKALTDRRRGSRAPDSTPPDDAPTGGGAPPRSRE